MKQGWDKFVRRVDGISLRERVLVFLAIAGLLIAGIKPVFFDPLLKEKNAKDAMVTQREAQLREVQERLAAVTKARANDANSPQRQRLEQVRQQIRDDKEYIKSISNKLVQPDEMADLLKRMLDKNGRLELIDLKTMPAIILAGVKAGGDATAEGQDSQIYKHGVTLTIRGSYLDLLQYLDALRELQTQMFWTNAEMKANYPTVDLKVTIYTLSLSKTWLQI